MQRGIDYIGGGVGAAIINSERIPREEKKLKLKEVNGK